MSLSGDVLGIGQALSDVAVFLCPMRAKGHLAGSNTDIALASEIEPGIVKSFETYDIRGP
jgi:hypothetical protein